MLDKLLHVTHIVYLFEIKNVFIDKDRKRYPNNLKLMKWYLTKILMIVKGLLEYTFAKIMIDVCNYIEPIAYCIIYYLL